MVDPAQRGPAQTETAPIPFALPAEAHEYVTRNLPGLVNALNQAVDAAKLAGKTSASIALEVDPSDVFKIDPEWSKESGLGVVFDRKRLEALNQAMRIAFLDKGTLGERTDFRYISPSETKGQSPHGEMGYVKTYRLEWGWPRGARIASKMRRLFDF